MRRLILMLLVAAGLIVLHQSSASAADFTVNSNGDGADAVPGNGVCATAGGTCTLRAAVTESEALTGSDTITVPAMTISLGSPLTITKTTTIRGAGPRATIVTGTFGHILLSIGGGDVVVRDLALQGASANGGGGLAVQQVGNAASKLINVRIANNTITGAVGTAYGPVYLIAGGRSFGLPSRGTRRRRLVRPVAVASTSPARRPGCWWRTPPFTRTRWSRPLAQDHSVAGS